MNNYFLKFREKQIRISKKKKSGRIIKERDRESTHRDKAASETNQPPPTSIDPLPFRFLTIHRVSIYLFSFLFSSCRVRRSSSDELDESGGQMSSGTAPLIIPYLDRLCRRLFHFTRSSFQRNPLNAYIDTHRRYSSSPRSTRTGESLVARAHARSSQHDHQQ